MREGLGNGFTPFCGYQPYVELPMNTAFTLVFARLRSAWDILSLNFAVCSRYQNQHHGRLQCFVARSHLYHCWPPRIAFYFNPNDIHIHFTSNLIQSYPIHIALRFKFERHLGRGWPFQYILWCMEQVTVPLTLCRGLLKPTTRPSHHCDFTSTCTTNAAQQPCEHTHSDCLSYNMRMREPTNLDRASNHLFSQ